MSQDRTRVHLNCKPVPLDYPGPLRNHCNGYTRLELQVCGVKLSSIFQKKKFTNTLHSDISPVNFIILYFQVEKQLSSKGPSRDRPPVFYLYLS